MGDANINEAPGKGELRRGEYCGAPAVASHGDVAREFDVLQKGCGAASLTWRRRLKVTGEDRVRWLNGMVTNNIRDLAPGHGVYAFLLNPQGKIQADMYCFNRGDDLLIETDASQIDHLRTILDKYIIMDDVEIADASHPMTLGFIGPKATDVVAGYFPETKPHDLAPLDFRTATQDQFVLDIVRLDDPVTPQFEIAIWNEDGKPAEFLFSPEPEDGVTFVGFEALEMLRIWSGRPRFGQDIRERDLPQETGQDRALNFSKGCYVGQEIVERIRSRGAVHRIFAGFAFESGPPQPGEKIMVDGKEAGEITSVATLPGDESAPLIGLGYIRREFSKAETVIHAGSTVGRVAKPPFVYVKANT